MAEVITILPVFVEARRGRDFTAGASTQIGYNMFVLLSCGVSVNKRTETLIARNKARVESDIDYINNRVYKCSETSCWRWIGSIGTDGYGKAKRLGKTIRAHRLVYSVFCGEIPAGHFVCHSCDNPLCVNPEHLWVGTHTENELDKTIKGRRSPSPSVSHPESLLRGERHHKSKLTADLVEKIYLLGIENIPAEMIKKQLSLNIDKTSIQRIVSGTSWRHLKLAQKYGEPLPQNIGERNPFSKLSSKSVLEIRNSRHLGRKELALRYEVSEATISNILGGRTWKHV